MTSILQRAVWVVAVCANSVSFTFLHEDLKAPSSDGQGAGRSSEPAAHLWERKRWRETVGVMEMPSFVSFFNNICLSPFIWQTGAHNFSFIQCFVLHFWVNYSPRVMINQLFCGVCPCCVLYCFVQLWCPSLLHYMCTNEAVEISIYLSIYLTDNHWSVRVIEPSWSRFPLNQTLMKSELYWCTDSEYAVHNQASYRSLHYIITLHYITWFAYLTVYYSYKGTHRHHVACGVKAMVKAH